MIKYLVKKVSIATDDNPTFAGKTSIAFIGKKSRVLALQGTANEDCHVESELTNWDIETFGYNRKCDAVRSWSYNNPDVGKYWKSKLVEIVAFEI